MKLRLVKWYILFCVEIRIIIVKYIWLSYPCAKYILEWTNDYIWEKLLEEEFVLQVSSMTKKIICANYTSVQ